MTASQPPFLGWDRTLGQMPLHACGPAYHAAYHREDQASELDRASRYRALSGPLWSESCWNKLAPADLKTTALTGPALASVGAHLTRSPLGGR